MLAALRCLRLFNINSKYSLDNTLLHTIVVKKKSKPDYFKLVEMYVINYVYDEFQYLKRHSRGPGCGYCWDCLGSREKGN